MVYSIYIIALFKVGLGCLNLVFLTKYRYKALIPEALESLREIFEVVCWDFVAKLVETNGEEDHMHLLVHYSPKVSVSKMVNSLKGVSSRLLKKKHPKLEKKYSKGKLWSPSYFAGSCDGASISVIRKYVEQQRRK